MLVPVDKGRRTAVMLAESIELGGNLGADFGLRQAARTGKADQPPDRGQTPLRRQNRHGGERRAQSEVEMQADLDPIAQTGKIARRDLPEGARRHGPGGMEAAGLHGLQNTGRDRLREAIIIGTYGQVAGEHAQIHGNGRTH